MLTQEFQKPVIKKFKKRKIYSRFKDNVRAVNFAEMDSLSSFNHGAKYLLCVINIYSEYPWVKPLTDKKS